MAYSLSNEYISNNKHSKRRRPQILKLKLKLELVFESILQNEIDIFKISRRSKHFRKIGRSKRKERPHLNRCILELTLLQQMLIKGLLCKPLTNRK